MLIPYSEEIKVKQGPEFQGELDKKIYEVLSLASKEDLERILVLSWNVDYGTQGKILREMIREVLAVRAYKDSVRS